MKKLILISLVFLAAGALSAETLVSAGAGGIYPPGTSFNGVPINALQSGFGVAIGDTGSAEGQFCVVLVGVTVLGQERTIVIEGKATSGSRSAPNVVTFSGSCTVNMGDGTPPTPGVPFSTTLTTDANDQGSIGLVIGLTALPNATVNAGSIVIK